MKLATVSTPDSAEPHRFDRAIAEFQKLLLDLEAAHDSIDQLRADLHREQGRNETLIEERNRYRYEAIKFRDKLVELATLQTQISLPCRQAEQIVAAVHELLNEGTPSSEALDQLETAFTKGNSGS